MSIEHELQNNFLEELKGAEKEVNIFLVNGIKLKGKITQYDNYAILLSHQTNQLVYKSAISTILPA